MILHNKHRSRRYKNHIGVTHPDIAKTFHPEQNVYQLEELSHGSDSKMVVWLCPRCQQSWSTTPFRRIHKNMNCPHCTVSFHIVKKSLGRLHKELLTEWDYEKNKNFSPFAISAKSSKRVCWRCKDCDHSWIAAIHSRTLQGSNCPKCQRKKHQAYMKQLRLVTQPNNLSLTHPHLELLWDREKNHPVMLEHLTPGSGRKTWWKCPHCQHSFCKHTFSFANRKTPYVCDQCQQLMVEKSTASSFSELNLTSA